MHIKLSLERGLFCIYSSMGRASILLRRKIDGFSMAHKMDVAMPALPCYI